MFGFIGSVGAATITVNPGQSIQTAVNSASYGDTIIVNSGTYYENIEVTKRITLTANGNVNIVAVNTQNPVITVRTSGTVVQNFKLSNSLVGVQFYGSISNNQLLNNVITGTGTSYGNGISFSLGTASNNLVQGNTISNVLHGILFNEGNLNNVVDCNAVTLGGNGAGIYSFDGSSGMIISNNFVTGAQDAIALQSLNGGLGDCFSIIGNTVTNSVNGLWMKLSNSVISYNTVTGCSMSGIDISGINNQIVNNTVTSNSVVGIIADQWGGYDNVKISGNVATYNGAGINTNVPGASITNNYVWHNGMGIVSTGGSAVVTGNNAGSNNPNYIIQGTLNSISNPSGTEYPVPVITKTNDPPATPTRTPYVVRTSPSNMKTVSRTATIYLKISENVYRNVYWNKIYVKNLHTHHLIHISKSISGHIIIIKTTKKNPRTWYQVMVPRSAVKNSAGNKLPAAYKFRFKTRS